jgi:hypothetical protein
LCLLIGELRSFTFSVIVREYVVIPVIFIPLMFTFPSSLFSSLLGQKGLLFLIFSWLTLISPSVSKSPKTLCKMHYINRIKDKHQWSPKKMEKKQMTNPKLMRTFLNKSDTEWAILNLNWGSAKVTYHHVLCRKGQYFPNMRNSTLWFMEVEATVMLIKTVI